MGQRQPRRDGIHVSCELVGLLCCDLSAIVRGRFVRSEDAERALDLGVGWVPANQALTPFGDLAPNLFGSIGDLRLKPDPATRVRVELPDGAAPLHFYLCDTIEPDGSPWDCCPRTLLRAVLDQVEDELGARVQASFEHEFTLFDDVPSPPPFSLEAVRLAGAFGGLVMDALAQSGADPETFLPEFGPHQFEVPCAPATGLAAADRSIVIKEVVRDVARHLGRRASFAADPGLGGVGSGTHLHMSLFDEGMRPLFHDAARPGGISELAGAFAAGVLDHARALCAFCAPSAVSYARLAPSHWGAGAAALGCGNRETLLRICGAGGTGVDAGVRWNLEFRGLDAAANPHLALAMVLTAGLDGIRRELAMPPLLDRDPADIPEDELLRFAPRRLPASLPEALEALDADPVLSAALPARLLATYKAVKHAEIAAAHELDEDECLAHYARVY